MIRHLCISVCLALVSAAIPMRAANKPRAGTDSRNPVVWTNDDLEKLRSLGLISIVGRMDEEQLTSASAPAPYLETQDPEWYAEQAAQLRDELERRRAKLHEYQKALEDARSLRETTGGINVDEGDTGITPEAGIEFLQQRLNEAQMGLDALEDLARRNDISPGALRGQ
ncbi:MAG: hypothetical protein WBB89_18090 [Candidatus Acidiferrum sp.]